VSIQTRISKLCYWESYCNTTHACTLDVKTFFTFFNIFIKKTVFYFLERFLFSSGEIIYPTKPAKIGVEGGGRHHTLLCLKWYILYVLCKFVTLQTSGVCPLLIVSTHFFFRTTPLVCRNLQPTFWPVFEPPTSLVTVQNANHCTINQPPAVHKLAYLHTRLSVTDSWCNRKHKNQFTCNTMC